MKVSYFVNFIDALAIDSSLLGQTIDCTIDPYYSFSVVFPKAKLNDETPKRWEIYYDTNSYGFPHGNFGIVSQCIGDGNSIEKIVPTLHGILISFDLPSSSTHKFGSCTYPSHSYDLRVSRMASNVVSRLIAINPKAYRRQRAYYADSYCEIAERCFKGENRVIYTDHHNQKDWRSGKLSKSEIELALKSANKAIPYQYELLNQATRSMYQKDYRSCILDYATIVEVTMQEEIDKFLESNSTPDFACRFINKKNDGYKYKYEFMKECHLPVMKDGDKVLINNLIDCRSRVIHGHYSPSFEEASSYYDAAHKVLDFYRIGLV